MLKLSLITNAVVLFLLTTFFIKQFLRNKRLKKWQDLWPDTNLLECHKDKLGNVWFEFENPLLIPSHRGVASEIAMNQADMCITRPRLTKFIAEIERLLNRGKNIEAFSHFQRLKDRLELVAEEETLTQLAFNYFLLEGEDPLKPNDEFNKRKAAIFEQDPDTRAFFLLKAFRLLQTSTEISDSDILNYLKQTNPNVSQK